MFKTVEFILFSVIIATCAAVHVDKCKDGIASRDGTFGSGKTEDVRISDCAESPCKLRKGFDATIEFDFTPDKTYEKLTTSVFGGIGIVRVPFREVHGMDACKDIKRKSDGKKGCPIEPDQLYTYTNSFPILKSYPAVSVNVQYGLNDGKSPVVCFTLPAKISN